MITANDENSASTPGSTPLPYSAHAGSSPSAAPIELDYISLPASSHPSPPAPPQQPQTSYNTPYPELPSTQYTPPGHASSSYSQKQQHPYQPVLSSVTVVDDASAAVDSSYTVKFQPKEVEIRYIQHIFNPKKKTFWVFWIIVLAIVFGILGGTVWKPKSKEENTSPPASNNGGSGGNPDWATCARGCSSVLHQCESSCRSSEAGTGGNVPRHARK
ncbi:hypothetical protein BG000_006979 [Podila horticola]|nr:hypothetical protein BG000_006979 [Podila horticola]